MGIETFSLTNGQNTCLPVQKKPQHVSKGVTNATWYAITVDARTSATRYVSKGDHTRRPIKSRHAITKADENIKRNDGKGKVYYLERCQPILQSQHKIKKTSSDDKKAQI
jgi:hypothetical protein